MYDNIEIINADGIKGLADEPFFDSIVIPKGASVMPESLQEQLVLGAKMVIPIGEKKCLQNLLTITRDSEDCFKVDDFGSICFGPLIGEDERG